MRKRKIILRISLTVRHNMINLKLNEASQEEESEEYDYTNEPVLEEEELDEYEEQEHDYCD